MPHFGVIGWALIVLAFTVVLAGVGAAATMGRTIAGTGGSVGGIVVGGLPVFFDKFGEGLNAMTGSGTGGATFTFQQQRSNGGNGGSQPVRQQRGDRQLERGEVAASTRGGNNR